MGRYGFGHGGKGMAHLLAQLGANAGGHSAAPTLSPSSAWNNTAGSGFAVAPADPVRITAKPIVRPIDPPNQFITHQLVYSVMAFANDGGTLVGGIDRVRFHCEGNTVDVVVPTMRSFRRYDGSTYSLPCYTVRLKRPAGMVGTANLYIEAIPADATMQPRVLGPIQFTFAAVRYDWDKTIGLIGSGADYQATTLTAATFNAIAAAKSAAVQNGRLTYISSGTSDLTHGSPVYTPQGYLTFECAPGVNITFAKPGYTTDADMVMGTRLDGMWFRGRGFTFDMAFASNIRHEAQASVALFFQGRSHVFEKVRFTRSTPPGSLIRKQLPGGSQQWAVRGNPWLLECDISNMQRVGQQTLIDRGCIYRDGFGDVCSGGTCLVGNQIFNWSPQLYRVPINAMTVHYTGAGATATLSLSGNNNTNNRVMTARVDGVSVGTFTILNTEAAWNAGTNYNVANVVNWINSLGGGWSATLQDDTRPASVLNIGTSGFGAFTNIDVKTAPRQLIANWDMHADVYETANNPGNTIFYGNFGTNIDGPFVFLGTATNNMLDWAFVNNAFSMAVGGSQPSATSQLGGPQGHVVFAHNTFSNQDLLLRTGAGLYNPDAYCMIASNSTRSIRWEASVDPDLLIKNNHLHEGQFGAAPGVGGTQGGSAATLYVSHAAGEFGPLGPLATSLKETVWTWDIGGKLRSLLAPAGALRE